MKSSYKFIMGVAAVALLSSAALAQATETVTQKSSTVNPDGSVSYESHTVVTKDPATPVVVTTTPVAASATTTTTVTTVEPIVPGMVTFYYYNPTVKAIASANDLTNDIISLWDADSNKVIDNHEFYNNAMVVYEPVEYSKRTYMDIDADGVPELTKEEYTTRLQQLPYYGRLNTDKKDGLTLYEFTGVGFQDADNDNNNQVSYDELKAAFYHEKGVGPKPTKENRD